MKSCPPLRHPRHACHVPRHGSALGEVVVCLPLLLLLIVAAAEATHTIHIQQSLKVTAYETARAATVPGATTADATRHSETLLAERRLYRGSVTFEPDVLAQAASGDFVKVTISVPHRSNALLMGWLLAWREMTAHVELMKE